MSDPLGDSESGSDRGGELDKPPGVPRWVKVAGIVAVVLVLVLIAVMLVSGGDHGPMRHSLERPPVDGVGQDVRGGDRAGGSDAARWDQR